MGLDQYVALGSSFAAGLGLGARDPGSPRSWMRTVNGYPKHLARLLGYPLIDMTCSGATARQVLYGGPFRRGAQVAGVNESTTLVTITVGGNDIAYVRDLTLLGYASRSSVTDVILRTLWKGPQPLETREFSTLQTTLRAILVEVRRRAPVARVVVVTYPPILPPFGTCPTVGVKEADATLMRSVGQRLAETTRGVAHAAGAIVVDMDSMGAGHDACAAVPWVNGCAPGSGAPFHPTLAGAEATAHAIAHMLGQGVPP